MDRWIDRLTDRWIERERERERDVDRAIDRVGWRGRYRQTDSDRQTEMDKDQSGWIKVDKDGQRNIGEYWGMIAVDTDIDAHIFEILDDFGNHSIF